MLLRLCALLTIAVCGVTALQAHHSPASHYIIKDLVTVEGVVTEFRLTNPHARIYFDVTTPEGEVQHWFAEGNSSSILKRRGWTKDSVRPGYVIKISGYPARDGGHALDWKLIELADGTQLRGGNTVGIEQDLLLADIDKKRHVESAQPPAETVAWKLDPLSYSIGNFSSFAEMVAIGLKKMALSQALPATEMDRLEAEVRGIADEREVSIYREADFLVTDLFPASATAGKQVLLIYRGDTLEEYLVLKKRKADLEAAGNYGDEARLEIAWAMGRLLSYPDKKIEQLLSE